MHKESFDFQEKKHNKILMPERIHLFKEKMKIAYRLIEFWDCTLEINYSKTFTF